MGSGVLGFPGGFGPALWRLIVLAISYRRGETGQPRYHLVTTPEGETSGGSKVD